MTDRDDLVARLERGLAALSSPDAAPEVRDALDAVVEVVGTGVTALLEELAAAGRLGPGLSRREVVDLLDLCGIQDPGPAPDPPTEVPVAIAPHPSRRCELCGGVLDVEVHRHVADTVDRRLLCVCPACDVLLPDDGDGRYRAVSEDEAVLVADEPAPPSWWTDLDLPVGIVFVVSSSTSGAITACFPGPAGIIESELPLDGLPSHVRPEPDVEALLVRAGTARFRAWRAPVSAAYRLAGSLRGADGALGDLDSVGAEFFDALGRR